MIKLNPRSDRLDNGKAYSHSLQKRDSQTWFPYQEIGIVECGDSWDHADVCACPIANKAQDSQFLAEVWGTSAKGKRGSCVVVAMKHRLSDRTRTLSSHRRWMIQVNLVMSMDCSAEQKSSDKSKARKGSNTWELWRPSQIALAVARRNTTGGFTTSCRIPSPWLTLSLTTAGHKCSIKHKPINYISFSTYTTVQFVIYTFFKLQICNYDSWL